MPLILTDSQKVHLSVSPVNAAGNLAPVEAPVWSSSDESVVVIVVGEDGLSADVVTTGKLGSAQVRFSCDAKIGEGESALLATLDVQVVAGQAVNVVINAGTPVER